MVFILLNFNPGGFCPEQIFAQSAAKKKKKKKIYYIFVPVTAKINVFCSDNVFYVSQNDADTVSISLNIEEHD